MCGGWSAAYRLRYEVGFASNSLQSVVEKSGREGREGFWDAFIEIGR